MSFFDENDYHFPYWSWNAPMLNLRNITVEFGRNVVLENVTLELAPGEVLCLLGPSGSGKSTLLRTVAGIDRPSGGHVILGGVEMSGPAVFVPPERRRIGMVFQDYALFPHLTVAANVAFGCRKEHAAVNGLLDRLGLRKYADSYPHMLSGGEGQRVALARAMAPKPQLLLMDEPFSSLDSRLRDDVRRHTLEFVRESRTTTIIVTHDPDEALRIGDRIALLDSGRLVQCDSPTVIYSRPATLFAARFFSEVAAFSGICSGGRIETPLGSVPAGAIAAGAEAVVCVRPQNLKLGPGPNGIACRVVSQEFRGESLRVLVDIEGFDAPLAVRTSADDAAALQPGMTVFVELDTGTIPVVALNSHAHTNHQEVSHAQ